MAKHIGIVACSAEGAALCYRTICHEAAEHMGTHFHPEITMHTHSLGDYMQAIRKDDWERVAELMLSSVKKAAAAGAEFVICPDNTIHQALPLLAEESPLPWLHIAEVISNQAINSGYRSLGILGTRFLMEGPVYSDILAEKNIEHQIPLTADRQIVNEKIFTELVNGIFLQETRLYFYDLINDFKTRGCDAVVLGCTEIPLIVIAEESPLPVLDSTRQLARAAIQRACST